MNGENGVGIRSKCIAFLQVKILVLVEQHERAARCNAGGLNDVRVSSTAKHRQVDRSNASCEVCRSDYVYLEHLVAAGAITERGRQGARASVDSRLAGDRYWAFKVRCSHKLRSPPRRINVSLKPVGLDNPV